MCIKWHIFLWPGRASCNKGLKHQNSDGHRAAVDRQITVPATSKDLAVMLDEWTTEGTELTIETYL